MRTPHYWTIGLVAACLAIADSAGGQVLLYDVDFGSPPHVVGQPPALGDGPPPRDTASTIPMGEPLVVAALGALVDQPCAFGDHPSALYDQLTFVTAADYPHGFGEAYPAYHVEMDVLVGALGSSDQFKIYVDCPIAHNVEFNAAGQIAINVLGTGGYSTVIGSYIPGTPLSLEIDMNIDRQEWSISVDGSPLFSGEYPSSQLRQVRLSMRSAGGLDTVAIDDVRVSGGSGASCDPCDTNCDGEVNAFDIESFLDLLFGGGNPCDTCSGDANGDGHIDAFDIEPFLACLFP